MVLLRKKSSCKLFAIYCQCYFISIAIILGTGVLGLPVTLSKAGFFPFLITFILSYLMQALVIIVMLEILQYCQAHLSQSSSRGSLLDSTEVLLLKENGGQDGENTLFDVCEDSLDGSNKTYDSKNEDSDTSDDFLEHMDTPIVEPNLHLIGKMFLHKYVNMFYLFIMFMHFVALLVSYSLAGSEAYGQIMQVNYVKVIPFFTFILATIITTARHIIQPVISLMTLAKGSMLFATILVTLWTGASVNNHISNDWKYTQGSFLMGTVALGGVPMVMPMLFGKFDPVREQMAGFRRSVIGGLTTCFVLNILWCWAVLSIVPQTRDLCLTVMEQSGPDLANSTSPVTTDVVTAAHTCDPASTLEAANLNGEISTVPLTKIIESDYPELQWVAFSIQLFILISITVSFLTLGSAMQHTISGWVDEVVAKNHNCKCTGPICPCLPRNSLWHFLFGMLCFTAVFTVAFSDPKGFITVLEKVGSFSLNLMAGPMTFLMIRSARAKFFRKIRIPLPTSYYLHHIHYVFCVYYSIALIYDAVVSILEVAGLNYV